MNEAFEAWKTKDSIHGGFVSKRDFEAGFQAASQHYEAKFSKMQAELDKARELLGEARPHISYLADISETVEKQLAEIDAFLKG